MKGDDTEDTLRQQVGLHTTEDDLQTTEDDLDMLEDDQKISLVQINKGCLNPFKYSEMILNYEGKMIDR